MNTDSAFLDLEMNVEVWLASERVPLEDLLVLEPGGVLPLSHDPDGVVDLVVNGARVASGELVVVEGRFGFRVTHTAQGSIKEATAQSTEAEAASAEMDVPEVDATAIDQPEKPVTEEEPTTEGDT